MYLKSMEIFGFKSFAEKTKVAFEPGITIIVGPNGCGKSNVVDALKWVIGEKQAKNIRGDKMEDVIFNGTEQRKPLSLAEVSLSIDNTNHILDIDSDQITITRRMFRDGESQYFINKSPVRLKDIETLFMDTGIGKSSYSVMEQGKIDMILSTRAEDRRYIFEEAAGISRFKIQRRDSMKKLEDTSANLSRINDIIKEIEREKDLKANQSEKTKQYLGLKSELVGNDVRLNLIKYHDSLLKRDSLAEDITRLKEKREELSARVATVSSENEQDEKKKNDIQLLLFEQDKKLHTYRIRSEDIDGKTAKNRRLIDEQNRRHADIVKKITERDENCRRLNADKVKTEEAGIEIQKKIAADREKLAGFVQNRNTKIESIRNAQQTIAENKKQIKNSEISVKELRERIEVIIKKLVDAIENRKAELIGSEQERQVVRTRIYERLDFYRQALDGARESINNQQHGAAAEQLSRIDLQLLHDDIKTFEGFEDGFRSILFDKTGIHAEKERLDQLVSEEIAQIERLGLEIRQLEERIIRDQKDLDDFNTMITRLEKDLSRNENERDWIERHIKSLDNQIQDITRQIDNLREELEQSETVKSNLAKEIAEWENALIEFNELSDAIKKEISQFTEQRDALDKKIASRKNVSKNDMENLERLLSKISEKDRQLIEFNFRLKGIEEYLWTEYEKKVADSDPQSLQGLDHQEIQNAIQSLKKRIQDLGPINNLAIEEFKDLKKRFEYYIEQRLDIEKAQKDILSVIEDINRTSLELFGRTFEEIKNNFSQIFKQLFRGGQATLELTDRDNILESGIDIVVRPPGKNPKSINLLSGGEKALTAIALLFATYMVKASPFCFLDEIDAPLDEENIGRFVKMLREFSRNTQFVIVTHNKKTMSIGESIYGVTMEEPGVSKVVSLKMEKVEKKVG